MNPIDNLVAKHPELDADALAAAYLAMDEEDDEDRPRAYTDDERAAHALVVALLQHRGLQYLDGTRGELSGRSRTNVIESVDLVAGESDAELKVLLPFGVFENLLADLLLLSGTQARAAGVGNAQELWLRRVQARLAEDEARSAWLASHADENGPS